MNTEFLYTLPSASVRCLLTVPGSAVLRVFLAIALASEDGWATASAPELADMTGLTERSVFKALAYLEDNGFIAREWQGPGPFANRIRIVEPERATVATVAPKAEDTEVSVPHTGQDEPESIMMLIAGCYRPLNEQEQRESYAFFKDEFHNCTHIRQVLLSLQSPRIVSLDAPLDFFLGWVRQHHCRLYASPVSCVAP